MHNEDSKGRGEPAEGDARTTRSTRRKPGVPQPKRRDPEAVEEKLARVGHTRLAEECEKLDMAAEQAMAEADFVEEGDA